MNPQEVLKIVSKRKLLFKDDYLMKGDIISPSTDRNNQYVILDNLGFNKDSNTYLYKIDSVRGNFDIEEGLIFYKVCNILLD